jgi:histidyl-tRNA synthetase
MALSTQPYKGARDFYPEEKRLQKYIFNKLRRTVESYGYEEYDAPILESMDLYLAKSGEEIVNEQTYAFEDRGGRKVVIRPEMTPTVSRMVAAKRQELTYPLRWYSIPNLWRYERPQKGRLREHWQLNVDIFGVPDMKAEIEIIQVMDSIMKNLGARKDMYKIRLNDRRFVNYLLHEYLGLDDVQAYSVSKLIDRMHKMERSDFLTQVDALCKPSQRDAGVVNKLLRVLEANTLHQLPAENNRSLFGGGRYDGLVGLFGVEPVATVGFGMGDVVMADFLDTHDLIPELPAETNIYVVLAGDVAGKLNRVLNELREEGVNVAVDLSGRALDKQMKAANKKGVPYVMVVGEEELREGRFKLKDMHTGVEEAHSIARIASIVEDRRRADNDRD